MNQNPEEKRYLEAAITLSRLYGIAETLNPWGYMENDTFIQTIDSWTQEFLLSNSSDILQFFESKIKH